MNKPFLNHFYSVRPRYELKQADALTKLVHLRLAMHPRPEHWDPQIVEHRVKRFGLANSQIESRGSEVSDYSDAHSPEDALFGDGKPAALEKRMSFFKRRSSEVMEKFYEGEKNLPNHLVHVTCTGYTAPNAAQEIASHWAEENRSETTVTNAYHMGCFAALPAIRIAEGLSLRQNGRVDIVHQELCSLHFDPLTLEPEQIVVQSLFADGHIRYSLTQEESAKEDSFQVLALREEILPESGEFMSWAPSSTHFSMHLSREVPQKIKLALKPFIVSICKEAGIEVLPKDSIYAIHPGGPKIIDAVETELDLNPLQTIESHEVLKHFGNMSSATLPHIWKKILENKERQNGTLVVSLAFGPGLTLSGGIYKLCRV